MKNAKLELLSKHSVYRTKTPSMRCYTNKQTCKVSV